MYGYVRPLKAELKIAEYENYRKMYCGLCRALKKRGGFFARFVVNYDFTFLAMLLSRSDKLICTEEHCPACLGLKRPCITDEENLSTAADESIILAWWKLEDGIHDSSLVKSLGFRILRFLLNGAYRKAAFAQSEFADIVSRQISVLHQLESQKCPGLDKTADTFARILQAAASRETDPDRRRIAEHLFYHIGRIVYILDAADDYDDDRKSGAYNPLFYRFSSDTDTLGEASKNELRATLTFSQRECASAFELLAPSPWTPIVSNTLFLGLPWTIEAVLCGQWKTMRHRKIKQEII